MVRYGAVASAVGTGAVHRAIASGQGLDRDSPRVQDFEQPTLQVNFERSNALMPVARQIYDTYQKAWNDACVKMHGNALEISSWRQQKLFVTGGGSCLPFLVDLLRTHPDFGQASLMALELPFDLIRADRQKIARDELPFLSVAYGLSNMESYLPNPYNREPG